MAHFTVLFNADALDVQQTLVLAMLGVVVL